MWLLTIFITQIYVFNDNPIARHNIKKVMNKETKTNSTVDHGTWHPNQLYAFSTCNLQLKYLKLRILPY